jgi:alanine racemase
MFETSKIELSRSALEQNLSFIRNRIKPEQKLCCVVKGNAYGHGLSSYVPMAMSLGVSYFAVHSADEAFSIVQSCAVKPDLFIMGSVDNSAIEWAIQEEIELAVFDFERLQIIISSAKKLGKQAKIHIEIETGMWRTGFSEKSLDKLILILNEYKTELNFYGLFTHLAGAESRANEFRITEQLEIFARARKFLESHKFSPKYIHTACSAGIINYPDAPGNMVRVGILQYGFWPNKETYIRFCSEIQNYSEPLKRVIRWTSSVMSLSEVNTGNFIGYGTSYFSHRNMKIAIIPIGYSHGYNRNLSNVGSVLIDGKEAPVVGVVNMNSITVDVTNHAQVKKGDQVVLIGNQHKKSISVSSFSEQAHQLNYELLTRLPFKIPRIVIK